MPSRTISFIVFGVMCSTLEVQFLEGESWFVLCFTVVDEVIGEEDTRLASDPLDNCLIALLIVFAGLVVVTPSSSILSE